MAPRVSRLISALAAGGVLSGSLLLGGGTAVAAPAPGPAQVVEAECGDTVTARPGDTVRTTPTLGVPFLTPVTTGMAPITETLTGLLCKVQVKVVAPIAAQAARVAPPLEPAADAVAQGTGAVLRPTPKAAAPVPARTAAPAPARAAPVPAPVAAPRLSPQALAAGAPAFAPAFGALPSSFLKGAAPAASAPAGLRAYDAGMLLGSAFPGLRAGAPAYLGYDPASAVTTASQVQALPVDGLSRGVGVPAVLAVLALSGVAAFVVRRVVLGRGRPAGAAPVGEPASSVGSGAPGVATAGGRSTDADTGDATSGSTELVGTARA